MVKQRTEDYAGKAYCEKVGLAIVRLGDAFEGARDLCVDPVGMSIRGPLCDGDEYLVVIRALDDAGGPVVGFHSALDLGEVLRGVESRLRNGSLKWRQDEFAK